jgi:hypothetical protein
MRVIVRREHPHPGAAVAVRPRSRAALPVLRHRHALRAAGPPGGQAPRPRPGRRPDPLRQGHRPGPVPVPTLPDQRRLAGTRPDRRGSDRLGTDHPADRRPGQVRTENPALPAAARRRPDHPRTTQTVRPDRRALALAHRAGRRLRPPHKAAETTTHLTNQALTTTSKDPEQPAPAGRQPHPAQHPIISENARPTTRSTAY